MRKLWKRIIFILLIVATFWLGTVASDRQKIQDNLLRLHVIANSDSPEDQSIKLQVRDAITQKLESAMLKIKDIDSAKAYIQENLGELQKVANDVLIEAGDKCRAVVTLAKSAFPQRDYETFSLPAGVYESLRVTIGDGEGQNWWCVLFPQLCVPAAATGDLCTLYGEDGVQFITEREITFSFKIWEWLGQLTDLFCA